MTLFPPFRPHPLLRSGHAQTVAGSLLSGRLPRYEATRYRISVDGDDSVVLHDDQPVGWQPTDRVALLVHGLCGSHLSPYVARPAARLNARGVRTFRMDLRSHGAGAQLASQIGHAGRSGDVAAALAKVLELCPQAPTYLIGFSMGANIVLKLAGELGSQAPANLAGVLAVAPPVDLEFCCHALRQGWNTIYDGAFARNLMRHFRGWWQANPRVTIPHPPRPIKSIYAFDEQITAPRSGFASAAEYYARSSSGPLLKEIQVPTLILAAADDPVVPIACIRSASLSSTTELVVTAQGGHLGYIGQGGSDADRRWLDWRVVDWVHAVRSREPAAFPRAENVVGTSLALVAS